MNFFKLKNNIFLPECLPAKCGRMVLDGVVTEKEAHGLLAIAKKGEQ